MAKKKQAAKQKQVTNQKQGTHQKQGNRQGQKHSQMNNRPATSQTQAPKAPCLKEVTLEKDWFEYSAERLEQFASYLAKVGQHRIAEETKAIADTVRAFEAKAVDATLPEVNEDLSGLWTILDMHAINAKASRVDLDVLNSAIEIYENSYFRRTA